MTNPRKKFPFLLITFLALGRGTCTAQDWTSTVAELKRSPEYAETEPSDRRIDRPALHLLVQATEEMLRQNLPEVIGDLTAFVRNPVEPAGGLLQGLGELRTWAALDWNSARSLRRIGLSKGMPAIPGPDPR